MLRKLTLAAARGLPREVIGRVPRDGGEPCLPAAALGANRSAFSQMRSVTSEKQLDTRNTRKTHAVFAESFKKRASGAVGCPFLHGTLTF